MVVGIDRIISADATANPRRGRGAFTLIELLVVIAIIALLISILVPALGSARRAARSVTCQSDLKNIAAWGQMYANDWDGFLPSHGDNTGGTGTWWGNISTTLWSDKAPAYGLGTMVNGAVTVPQPGSVFFCPEAAGSVVPRNQIYASYGLNQYLGAGPVWGESQTTGTGFRFCSSGTSGAFLVYPKTSLLHSQTYWFCDARVFNRQPGFDFHPSMGMGDISTSGTITPQDTWCWPWTHTGTGAAQDALPLNFPGHPGQSANLAMGDGHVENWLWAGFARQTPMAYNIFVDPLNVGPP
jgi:prepilin-type N-terminal cleavage/methylation domain-containing protein/prepilin-type processing-associated H-X9-DG protein